MAWEGFEPILQLQTIMSSPQQIHGSLASSAFIFHLQVENQCMFSCEQAFEAGSQCYQCSLLGGGRANQSGSCGQPGVHRSLQPRGCSECEQGQCIVNSKFTGLQVFAMCQALADSLPAAAAASAASKPASTHSPAAWNAAPVALPKVSI